MSKAIRSTIVNNVINGCYIKQRKFADFGSVVEDSIVESQKAWMKRLAIIQQAKKDKLIK
tara:strand:- start:822 stop:1001 length:180 start_codon:yes stop_codon:yes gene_type:complete